MDQLALPRPSPRWAAAERTELRFRSQILQEELMAALLPIRWPVPETKQIVVSIMIHPDGSIGSPRGRDAGGLHNLDILANIYGRG